MPKPQKNMIISIPSPGRWSWNDETQDLEFTSTNLSEEVQDKRKKSKHFNVKDLTSNRVLTAQLSLQMQSFAKRGGQTTRKTLAKLTDYQTSVKESQSAYVTIEDIKQVAVSLLLENDVLIPLCFVDVLKSKVLNDFLAALLLYMSCYLERKGLEKKAKPLMAEQSLSEKTVMVETLAKVDLAQKQLAFCYSSLVLGLDLSEYHHMACGRHRVSSTYKDRKLYECLYSFFCYLAWVTFGRKELRGIQEEVGRLLSSDTFNPALRTRVEDVEDNLTQDTSTKEGQPEPKEHSQSHNAPEKRKSQHRLALCKLLAQRSPLMVSLLPHPVEEAPHLFRRNIPRKQSQVKIDPKPLMEELKMQLASFSFGILGKPVSQFNSTTLIPQGAENDDDEDPDIHVTSTKTMYLALRPGASAVDYSSSASHVNSVISLVPTEAASSDTDN